MYIQSVQGENLIEITEDDILAQGYRHRRRRRLRLRLPNHYRLRRTAMERLGQRNLG